MYIKYYTDLQFVLNKAFHTKCNLRYCLVRGEPVLFRDSFTFTTGVWKFSLFFGVGAKDSLGSNFLCPVASLQRCSHLLAVFCALKTNFVEWGVSFFTPRDFVLKKRNQDSRPMAHNVFKRSIELTCSSRAVGPQSWTWGWRFPA